MPDEDPPRQRDEAERQTKEASRQTEEAERQTVEAHRQTEEAGRQAGQVLTEAEVRANELRMVAREAAREVVDEAILTATRLDETQGDLSERITKLIGKVGVRRRHAVVLYLIAALALVSSAVSWWSVQELARHRCEALNEFSRRQHVLWDTTIADLQNGRTPEQVARQERFQALLATTFPQEDCG